ncbi:MAG: queuosine salvage family protein [Gaiellales bacterium]
MPDTVFDRVRQACAEVAARSRSVAIDEARLDAYVESLADTGARPVLDPAHHYLGCPAETAGFVVTLDAINFGSGWWPQLRKLPGLSGYFTIATQLTRRYREGGPLTALELAELGRPEAADIFGQSSQGPVGELMGHFAHALNELGRLVLDRFDGRFDALVLSAEHSAERLLALLTQLPYFRDVAVHGDLEVPLYKRAQLASADLALALPDSPLGRFDDLDRLTIFADNLVPHVLRVDGVLRYEPDLAARIDAARPLEAGAREEVEIRAGGLHAVELLVNRARGRGRELTAMQADYVLWNRGQEPAYKAIPRHRARSLYY